MPSRNLTNAIMKEVLKLCHTEKVTMVCHHLEKRKCNTATCVTQRLADFLVRSSNNIGAIYSPTNVGSYTYGKRDSAGLLIGDPFNYLQV
ncbi:islet amyloid polypeptide [Microcaecilia unicolor]|uniref:Islet amyloid polypeptide n=1 Tax=Microcaecilia unicolor TaxID=1415580 RepID=A0A6P7YQK3_9AMPH|nr:islet amyloid polypeptide [Microcaecilia unicolor]